MNQLLNDLDRVAMRLYKLAYSSLDDMQAATVHSIVGAIDAMPKHTILIYVEDGMPTVFPKGFLK